MKTQNEENTSMVAETTIEAEDVDNYSSFDAIIPTSEPEIISEMTKPNDAVSYASGFRSSHRGVEYFVETKDTKTGTKTIEWNFLCSPLEVVAEARDEYGKGWGRLLLVTDRDGKQHEYLMRNETLSGNGDEYRKALLSLGLYLSPCRSSRFKLAEYIQMSKPTGRVLTVSHVGWSGKAFVLPDDTIGDTGGERVLLLASPDSTHTFRVSGTLEEWQKNVAELCIGNSLLMFSVSAAFAAPMLHLTGNENGGFHFRGSSSSGKTTVLQVAGSVCGGGGLKGYLKQWRTTDNGLEAVAVAHCDLLLCLDELSQVDPKAAGAAAYMLANGAGKSRAGRSGEGREPAEWRTLFLSNGEISLADKIAEESRGRRVAAGQSVRIIDLLADTGAGLGAFENLHGATTADAFAQQLKKAAGQYYGTALRAYLKAITANLDSIMDMANEFQKTFFADNVKAGVDGQVSRGAKRFALVAAAGEIAIRLGVVPWAEGDAEKAAVRCFNSWLANRGGTGAAEELEWVSAVRGFIEQHGESRFTALDSGSMNITDTKRQTINRAGFRRENKGGTEYFVLSEAWKKEVCAGFDHKAVAEELVALGLIVPGEDRRMQSNHRLPGSANPIRCYHLSPKIMGSIDD